MPLRFSSTARPAGHLSPGQNERQVDHQDASRGGSPLSASLWTPGLSPVPGPCAVDPLTSQPTRLDPASSPAVGSLAAGPSAATHPCV